jgi:DNA-binding NarL/FixJ family response regulator
MEQSDGTVRVMLIDDSRATRLVMRRFIESVGMTVVGEADNAEDGVELAEREQPDILFLDVVLPRVSGVDVLKRVRPLLPQTAIIMVTSIAERDTVTECRDLGADGYVLKPLDREKILSCAQRVLSRPGVGDASSQADGGVE